MTAPDPRLDEIQARLSADWEASMSGGYIGDDQCMKDRDFLLAELRKAREALARVGEIHQRVEGYIFGAIPGAEPDWPVCSICFTDDERPHAWPRPTMAAVAAAKGDERG